MTFEHIKHFSLSLSFRLPGSMAPLLLAIGSAICLLPEHAFAQNPHAVNDTLACMGYQSAEGINGLPLDRVRALGFYVASGTSSCRNSGKDSKREAAEIILAMNPGASWDIDHTAIFLLRSGPPKNWLRAVQVMSQHYHDAQYVMPTVFRGIQAGRANGGEHLDVVDLAALRTLNLMLGEYYLGQGNMAAAYGSLIAAEPAAAAEPLAVLQKRLRYRLILQNGLVWNASHAAN